MSANVQCEEVCLPAQWVDTSNYYAYDEPCICLAVVLGRGAAVRQFFHTLALLEATTVNIALILLEMHAN